MKHNKMQRILFSVLGYGIFICWAWQAWKDFHGVNLPMGLFIIAGMIASLWGINWVVEHSSREEDKGG